MGPKSAAFMSAGVRKRPQNVRECRRAPCILGSRNSSRNAELSSLVESRRVFASQKCQLPQGSGESWTRNAELSFWTCVRPPRFKNVNRHRDLEGSWPRNAELSSLLDLRLVAAFKSANSVGSPRFKSANRHRDRGNRGCETQNCRHSCSNCSNTPCKHLHYPTCGVDPKHPSRKGASKAGRAARAGRGGRRGGKSVIPASAVTCPTRQCVMSICSRF